MKKLMYTPFSIGAGLIGARAGRRAFKLLWGGLSEEPKPSPKDAETSLARLAFSAALEGATLAAASAVATQLSVRLFHHLFGIWPVKPKSGAGDAV
jgi:Protein of unknown function (DUF4235)